MITNTRIAMATIGLLALTTTAYAMATGNPLNDGLIYTAIAGISGLAGFELGDKK